MFGDTRRKINLGGASSSKDSVSEARALRAAREQSKKERESAILVQATYRAYRTKRNVKAQIKAQHTADPHSLTGLRCLVLVEEYDILASWSAGITPETLLGPIAGPQRDSWLVLLRQVSLLLLRSVSQAPRSPYAVAHLNALNVLLSPQATTRVVGEHGTFVCLQITSYLLQCGLYPLLASAISSIPLAQKNTTPALPLIIPLITFPIATLTGTQLHASALGQLITTILTIPLLPNRLPIASLTALSGSLPFSSLHIAEPALDTSVPSLSHMEKVHLLANLVAFTPARYAILMGPTLGTYLQLISGLMDALQINALEPPLPKANVAASRPVYEDSDSDSEDTRTSVSVVTSFATAPPPLPPLDARTQKRLLNYVSADHIASLISASSSKPVTRLPFVKFLLALGNVWPGQREAVLRTVVVKTNGGLVRELYREFVRGSPLGTEGNVISLIDLQHAEHWPPVLFLADLYTHSLVTMGDDEFFSAPGSPRNPLTTDDLTSFSKTLLNIAFTLFWKDDQMNMQEGGVPGTRMSWIAAREKVTKCLVAIHARDSRRPFTPKDHWLVTNQLDLQSFVEAAIYEDSQASAVNSTRALSKRQLSLLSPRLGVLNNIPFAIPFEVRVAIFRSFVLQDMRSRGESSSDRGPRGPRTIARVRRSHVAEDCFNGLGSANLKNAVQIQFIDQFGEEEMGIDGGGLFKEALTSLVKEVFDSDRGLWLHTSQQQIYPNPNNYAVDPHNLNWYKFIGRILGKAMYDGILVDVSFASFFLAKWLGTQSFLGDLASLDNELYKGLIFLKHYTGRVEDLSLYLPSQLTVHFGVTTERDLVAGGSSIPVTKDNRLQYIQVISHYRLTRQIKKQSEAFFEGLSEMIDPKWLRMFNQQEVQILLGGVNTPVDLEDLRANTLYGGLYDDKHDVIQAFWNVVETFDHDERQELLRFITSCSRPPLLGFKELNPKFAIRDAGGDQSRLPTSSTCVNLLKLPRYDTEQTLRQKLLQAIHSGAGFDLS